MSLLNSSIRSTTQKRHNNNNANVVWENIENHVYFELFQRLLDTPKNQAALTTREYTSQRTFRDIVSSRTNKCCRFPTQTSKFKGKCMAKKHVFSLPKHKNWLYSSNWYINRCGLERRIYRCLIRYFRETVEEDRGHFIVKMKKGLFRFAVRAPRTLRPRTAQRPVTN